MKIFALLLCLTSAFAAHGKCPSSNYIAAGKVVLEGGQAAKGATVGISWTEHGDPAGPVIGTTNSLGMYRIRIPFQIYSGEDADGDMCNGKLTKLAVIAYSKQMQSYPTVNNVKFDRHGITDLGVAPLLFKRLGQ